ncbi:glutaminase A [Caulobacter sp. 17J80-11]|uniref:glutaminase A n=1 Tax=Caulobacter sp. 17J80-11 TaxID=2763502 RepID=UPI00165381A4|nr:glutaminase A [Caulobacter sp. 17J80-11]MBC6982033.1 glutaminase A [Caulobacter sp. 17J80-11]
MDTTRRRLALGLGGIAIAGAAASAAPANAMFFKKEEAGVAAGAADKAVKAAFNKYRGLQEGKNADYIPALAKVPSSLFGIALLTPGGQQATAGDIDSPFSIQSISKVFTMILVMQESGPQKIEETVGVDATGRVFNSIEAIEQYKGKEMNPLVNPGAIATVGNVKGASADEVWKKILAIHSAFAGRQLEVNQEVYKSESDTNQRNRAISALMSAYERFPGDPAQAVDLYTRQCSINVTAKDLGVMAATMANGGKNPVSKQQIVDPKLIAHALAVMATAGLYDDSGKWLFHTGLPAKSGVGGGLMAVSPGKFGIGTFSPPLDEAGNSVRGQRAITDVSNALGGNPYMVRPV